MPHLNYLPVIFSTSKAWEWSFFGISRVFGLQEQLPYSICVFWRNPTFFKTCNVSLISFILLSCLTKALTNDRDSILTLLNHQIRMFDVPKDTCSHVMDKS
jgi:hypothetical protein